MKNKIGILVMGLVIAGMVFPLTTMPNIVKAGPSVFYCWINAPSVGWDNEAITFTGGGHGGYSPYYYRWDWTNDGTYDTGWSSSLVTHTYNPTVSPTTYTVKMQGKDSSNPTQYCTVTQDITVYKKYDIGADVWAMGVWFEGVPLNIYCEVTLEDEVAPGFDWHAQCIIYNLITGDPVKTFNIRYGTTLNNPGDKDSWTEVWYQPTGGFYRAYLTITPGHDSYAPNNEDYQGIIIG